MASLWGDIQGFLGNAFGGAGQAVQNVEQGAGNALGAIGNAAQHLDQAARGTSIVPWNAPVSAVQNVGNGLVGMVNSAMPAIGAASDIVGLPQAYLSGHPQLISSTQQNLGQNLQQWGQQQQQVNQAIATPFQVRNPKTGQMVWNNSPQAKLRDQTISSMVMGAETGPTAVPEEGAARAAAQAADLDKLDAMERAGKANTPEYKAALDQVAQKYGNQNVARPQAGLQAQIEAAHRAGNTALEAKLNAQLADAGLRSPAATPTTDPFQLQMEQAQAKLAQLKAVEAESDRLTSRVSRTAKMLKQGSETTSSPQAFVKFADQNLAAPQSEIAKATGDALTPQAYAKTFNVPLQQAEKEVGSLKQTDATGQPPKVTPLEQAAEKQAGMRPKLTAAERRQLIAEDITQQTKNKVGLNVPEGNVKGGIAQAEGIADERLARFSKAVRAANRLSQGDKALLSDALNGEKVTPANPSKFNNAMNLFHDAYDYSLASDRAAGGTTLRWQHGKYSPLYLQATDEQMAKLGIPAEDRIANGNFHGFRDSSRQFKSYRQADAAGLKRLYPDAIEDAKHYALSGDTPIRQNLLKQAMLQAAPKDTAELGMGRETNTNAPFRQAPGGLPFNASEYLQGQLKGYGEGFNPRTPVGKAALGALKGTNSLTKAALFFSTPFHYANLIKNYLGLTVTTGHLPTAIEGAAKGVFSQLPGGYDRLVQAAEENGTMSWIRQAGLKLHEDNAPLNESGLRAKVGSLWRSRPLSTQKLTEFTNTLAIQLGDVAREHGVVPTSAEGVKLAQEYGKVLGLINSKVAGDSGMFRDVTRFGGLAPQWTRSQLGLLKDSATGGVSHGIGLFNTGDVARGTVIGSRFLEAATGIIVSAIAAGKMPTFQQVLDRGGFNLQNPVPNIQIPGEKNAKGEQQLIDLPTDPGGLGVGLVTDPPHFVQSRLSPVGSAAMKLVTNQDWNGQPLADRNLPGWQGQTALKIAQGFLPIAVQNATNPNLSIGQGLVQDIGGRFKTDPNDPQAKANTDYFNLFGNLVNTLASGKFSQINPALRDIPPDQAHQWVQAFNALHPQDSTEPTGQKYPQRYNPLSSEAKFSAYTMVGPNNQQTLSPIFYADQRLALQTPGYPTNPLYKLSGTGTDVNGNHAPQALVALQYQHAQTPGQRAVIVAANGGPNGWLSKYETTLGAYSQHYQQNLTQYFQKLGWSQQAVDDYWKNHPSTPDPIDQVQFDQQTTALLSQYSRLEASGNSTDASRFFSQHADVLGVAFDQLAQHANALRAAKGELQLQGYPPESTHVKAVLASMPAGADTASKRARAQLINGNPDVNQYLANVALYESLSKGAQFQYVNPAHPQATEGQNINAAGSAGQSFLKDTQSLGKYDIGKNAQGQYAFMQNGSLPGGSGSSGSKTARRDIRLTANFQKNKLKVQTPRHVRIQLARNYLQGAKIKAKVPRPGRQPGLPIATF